MYTLFLKLYPVGIRIASIWNDKAKLWIKGREKFPFIAREKHETIWMHCASLGEFEQGRPVIEKIREEYPGYSIVITFFSPSGYEIQKNYKGADHILYLPMDSYSNAKKFISLINPTLVLWVKYEYWHYYLHELKKRNIPLLLISGAFRKDQPFFKGYGNFWRKMLDCFTFYFVQNQQSKNLLESIHIDNVSVCGDTRFDRVKTIAENFDEIPWIKQFCSNSRVIVAGSTWEDDEAELVHYAKTNRDIKFIIAPHEVDKENLADVKKAFKGSIFYSEWLLQVTGDPHNYREADLKTETLSHFSPFTFHGNVLIIDNIGMLSRLYKYAHITYVGGGFGDDGLHNVLEAAVYGKPVIFGPVFEKNFEAEELIDCGGAITIENALELEKTLDHLFNASEVLDKTGAAAKNYVYSHGGATKKIMEYVQEKRLLTS